MPLKVKTTPSANESRLYNAIQQLVEGQDGRDVLAVLSSATLSAFAMALVDPDAPSSIRGWARAVGSKLIEMSFCPADQIEDFTEGDETAH